MKLIAVVTSLGLVVAGCKGDTKYKDTPETLSKLDNCNKALSEKDKLIKEYETRIAALEMAAAQQGEFVVTIDGNALTVKKGRPAGAPGIDDATATAMTKDFLDQVEKSRGAIQKCYEQALKKNTSLQARTVTLKLSASFAQTGSFQRTSFNPSLGDTFDNCLRGVAGRWKLKPAPQSMTFQASVSLVPA